MNTDIRCALSGTAAPLDSLTTDDDTDGAVPLEWLWVTVRRRRPNPEWLRHAQTRETLIQTSVAQVLAQRPPDAPELAGDQLQSVNDMFRSQFEAMYFAILAATPRWVDEIEEVFIAPPSSDRQIAETWTPMATALGVTLGVVVVTP